MKSSRAKSKTQTDTSPSSKSVLQDPNFHERVAVAAYFKAEARKFAPGNELEDWLSAETELMT